MCCDSVRVNLGLFLGEFGELGIGSKKIHSELGGLIKSKRCSALAGCWLRC